MNDHMDDHNHFSLLWVSALWLLERLFAHVPPYRLDVFRDKLSSLVTDCRRSSS